MHRSVMRVYPAEICFAWSRSIPGICMSIPAVLSEHWRLLWSDVSNQCYEQFSTSLKQLSLLNELAQTLLVDLPVFLRSFNKSRLHFLLSDGSTGTYTKWHRSRVHLSAVVGLCEIARRSASQDQTALCRPELIHNDFRSMVRLPLTVHSELSK